MPLGGKVPERWELFVPVRNYFNQAGNWPLTGVNWTCEMPALARLTDDLAVRFDLGAKARVFIQELWTEIVTHPGGVEGFLCKAESAGLAKKVASWLKDPYPMALSAREAERVLGADNLKRFAENTGLSEAIVKKALGYAIPMMIGRFAADGAISENTVARLRYSGSARLFAAPRIKELTMGFRLLVPGAALLLTLGVFGYAISFGTAGDRAFVQSMPGSGGGSQEALNLSEGDRAVEAGWIKNLDAPRWVKGGNGAMLFAGNLSGLRDIAPAMESAFVPAAPSGSVQQPQFVVASLMGSGPAAVRLLPAADVSRQASAEFPPVIFAPNSAAVPLHNLALLRRIAAQIDRLPPDTMVVVHGYVHGTVPSPANEELARQRAEAVRQILIRDGLNPRKVSAKGTGGAPSLASADSGLKEGRSSRLNTQESRRVEFEIIQP